MDAGQAKYLAAPARMEGGQIMMQAPHMAAPMAVEGSQVMVQAPHLTAPAVEGQVMIQGQVPAGAEGDQVMVQAPYLMAPATMEVGQVMVQGPDPAGEEGGLVMVKAPHLMAPSVEGQMMMQGQVLGAEGGQVEGPEAGQVTDVTAQMSMEAEIAPRTVMEPVRSAFIAAPAAVESAQTYSARQVCAHAAPPLQGAPARVTVPPEIFSKLAMGGTLTDEEMARLIGESALEQAVPEMCVEQAMPPVSESTASVLAGPGSVAPEANATSSCTAAEVPEQVTPPKASEKTSKKKSKKAMKASKKEKVCC